MNNFIVLDIETTGISPRFAKITEIGAIKVIDNKIKDTYQTLINPLTQIPDNIIELTGITNEMVKDAKTIDKILPDFFAFADEPLPILGHNVLFDYSFIKHNAVQYGYSFNRLGIDTLSISRYCLPHLSSKSLSKLCIHYNIERNQAHRGLDDAQATYKLFTYLRQAYGEKYNHLFVPKQLHYKPKKDSPITPRQKMFLQSLITQYQIIMEKNIDGFSKSEASKTIDEILFKYGRKHV